MCVVAGGCRERLGALLAWARKTLSRRLTSAVSSAELRAWMSATTTAPARERRFCANGKKEAGG